VTTIQESDHVLDRPQGSWYDLVGNQLQDLTELFAVGKGSTQLKRAYQLICKEALGFLPATEFDRLSRLNHDGTPIQFALSVSHGDPSLQFLSEIAGPGLSLLESIESAITKVRRLSAMLRLTGDTSSLVSLLYRLCAPELQRTARICEYPFWIGAGLCKGGKVGIKIYINGRTGEEREEWTRLIEFATFFGASDQIGHLRQLLAGQMTPLGMAIGLNQVGNPTGRIYFSAYGKRVSYYEDLLRTFVSTTNANVFRNYSEFMLGEDYSFPTQTAVFSIGLSHDLVVPADVKIEFCGHCLFRSDQQARNRCLRWLAQRGFDSCFYEETLAVLANKLSSTKVNNHVYIGIGWKKQEEYKTIYLKPHFERSNA
jgi:hypothetical protein